MPIPKHRTVFISTIPRQVTRAVASRLLCRYLVETPANICTPQYLAETAGRIRDLAPERFSLTVHDRPAVEKMGMGLYLGAPNCQKPQVLCLMHEGPAVVLGVPICRPGTDFV